MCTIVLLRRPGHGWPLVLGANRDEMADRPWHPPARHWPGFPGVVAGLDDLAGGTWFGLNDHGVAAAVLNRVGTLGPKAGYRSRGELPLIALEQATARAAAERVAGLAAPDWRPFNLVVADAREAFWLASDPGAGGPRMAAVPDGLSMLTAHDLNDAAGSPRQARFLPLFRAAPPPDPAAGDWTAWKRLMASSDHASGAGGDGAMCVALPSGFGTVSSSLLALPGPGGAEPVWLFAGGPPDKANYASVLFP